MKSIEQGLSIWRQSKIELITLKTIPRRQHTLPKLEPRNGDKWF